MTLFKLATACILAVTLTTTAQAEPIAKQQFGAQRLPAVEPAQALGFYSKGCLAGGVAIPTDGETWQTMRLSRNRRWGHPDTIATVMRLSRDATRVGWPGLLVGDISQPRGGPMLTGHASHQLGLDADIWLTPMPNRTFSDSERESTSATSMLARRDDGSLNQNRIGQSFTKATFGLIKTAASYGQVERILVHPTIKKELCRMEGGTGAERRWLYKVRPYWGHHYHMHMRLSCPAGSPNCRPQAKPNSDDGCGADLAYWDGLLNPKPKKVDPNAPKVKAVPRKPKPEIRVADLPNACRGVLTAPRPATARDAEMRFAGDDIVLPQPTPVALNVAGVPALGSIATPVFRPGGN